MSYKNWTRRHKTLTYYQADGRGLAQVWRVRVGHWRAQMTGRPGTKREDQVFGGMDEACAWAQARLTLYELPGLA